MSSGGWVSSDKRVSSGKKGRKKVRPATAAPAIHHIPVTLEQYNVHSGGRASSRPEVRRQSSTSSSGRRASSSAGGRRSSSSAGGRRSSKASRPSTVGEEGRHQPWRKSLDLGSSDSDSDEPDNRPPAPVSAPSAHLDSLGVKLRQFQGLRFPSSILDPNPDCIARQKPYPVILDTKAYGRWCEKVSRVKTVSESRRELDDIIRSAAERVYNSDHPQVKPFPAFFFADRRWDTGPKFTVWGSLVE
eukprot:sb/3468929/